MNILTVAEIAERIRKHPVTVRLMLQEGKLAPALRIGRIWHMREEDLKSYIDRCVLVPLPARARRGNCLIPKPKFVEMLHPERKGVAGNAP